MPEWIHLSWCVLKMHHGVLSRRWAWEKSWNLRRKRQLRVIRCKSLFLSCHVLLKIFSQDEYILVESCYLLLKYLKTLIIGWVLFCKLLSSTVIWYKIIKKKIFKRFWAECDYMHCLVFPWLSGTILCFSRNNVFLLMYTFLRR